MRLFLLPLLLLAACAESRPADQDASTGAAQSFTATDPGAQENADLPDSGDPRLFLDLDSLRWSRWESPPSGDRGARLRALGIVPIRSDSTGPRDPINRELGSYDPYGENPRDFHFVDFSGDGVDDVIYSGPWFVRNEDGFGALEGTQIKLYQVIDGRAVQVMAHHGTVQRIWKGAAGEPVSFRAVHWGCCGDSQWTVDYFRPVRAADTVRFQPYHRVVGRDGIQIPTAFMDRPRPFTVRNEPYLLRATPAIVEHVPGEYPEWNEWEGHGNAVAEYGRGARGIALAERTDATGRVWWFVRMDGRTPPRDAQFPEAYSDGLRMDRVGWMSSRFVDVEP